MCHFDGSRAASDRTYLSNTGTFRALRNLRPHGTRHAQKGGAKGEHDPGMVRLQDLNLPGAKEDSADIAELCEAMLFAGARRLGFKVSDEMTIPAQEKILAAAASLTQGMMHYLMTQVGVARVRELIESVGKREPELGN
jgi:hypothetical protein